MQQWRTCPGAGHVRQRCGARPPLHVNRGAARVEIGNREGIHFDYDVYIKNNIHYERDVRLVW